jgi:Protein of unknown function (DUF2628)
MTVYTVHEPPPREGQADADTDRFAFVRDGFYFWAFLFGPLWMIWRRLWLVLILYLIVTVALQVGLHLLGVSNTVKFVVGFLIALLVGFEAATLRRWTYWRRGWRNPGVVVGPDMETAERRFFDSWVVHGTPRVSVAAPPAMRMPEPAPQVIGLFPEPEQRR